MPIGATRLLWILTPITATMSLVLFTVAISTNDWLHSEEKIKVELNVSRTEDNFVFLPKLTVSGLWVLCYTEPGQMEMHCIDIDYFPKTEYSPDPYDSTLAIPYAVTRAAAFYFLSTVMLILGELFCIFGHCCQNKRIFIFVSGCIFITTGLTILAGLVIYISTFKSEVGIKLQEQSSLQPPLFTYRYGFSFLLVVSCFMSAELTGTSSIFLYINLHKKQWLSDGAGGVTYRGSGDGPAVLPDDFPQPPCRRHHRRRRGSRFHDYYASRENSPRPSLARGIGYSSSGGALAHSESMRDLSYYSLPLTSRDITSNTVSTTADINRDYSREFSYETLRRTTPV